MEVGEGEGEGEGESGSAVAQTCACDVTFCHAHCAHGWVAEHHSGDVLVHQPGVGLAAKQAVGQGTACCYGNGGQLKLATHITQCIHVGCRILELHGQTEWL